MTRKQTIRRAVLSALLQGEGSQPFDAILAYVSGYTRGLEPPASERDVQRALDAYDEASIVFRVADEYRLV